MESKTCGWRCGDTTPDHQHYTVIIRDKSGKLVGRLCPDGTATNRVIYAAILSRATADQVAQQINARGEFAAKVAPF